jgi:hypothetical protein
MSETQDNTTEQNSEDLSNALQSAEGEFVTGEQPKPALNQGLLYLLLLVTIGGGGTYLMYKRSGPAAASAASVETAQAQQTINNFLTTGPNGIKVMQEMLHNTEKIVQQFLDYPSVPQIPLSALHTNPFRFAKADADAKPDADAEKKKKDEERAAALHASQGLNLQSIISGNHKACMINNTLYTEGQQVDQFTIEKIAPHSVIVKTGTYRFELRMQK